MNTKNYVGHPWPWRLFGISLFCFLSLCGFSLCIVGMFLVPFSLCVIFLLDLLYSSILLLLWPVHVWRNCTLGAWRLYIVVISVVDYFVIFCFSSFALCYFGLVPLFCLLLVSNQQHQCFVVVDDFRCFLILVSCG